MLSEILDELITDCQFKLQLDSSYRCGREVLADGMCVFHIQKPSKAEKSRLEEAERAIEESVAEDFRAEFKKLLAASETAGEEKLDLRGFEFPDFEYSGEFAQVVDLTDAQFRGDLKLTGARFLAGAKFFHAHFHQDVDFAVVTFEKKASFEGATFKGEGDFTTRFLDARFLGGCNFTGAAFQYLAQFSGASFGVEGAEPRSMTLFGMSTRFENDAVFDGAHFFNQTTFGATFGGSATFRRAEFKAFAKFADSKFGTGRYDFSKTTFGAVDFNGIDFPGEVDFSEAAFEGQARFDGVRFEHEAEFAAARFAQSASFVSASFPDGGDFQGATFEGPACFSGATLDKKMRFAGIGNECFLNKCYFDKLTLLDDAKLSFSSVSLRRASFLDTNLDLVTLRGVKWERKETNRVWLRRTYKLWDEFREFDNPPRPYENIAENYRQLVLNYERSRDYEVAEDFHFGEMEMRRERYWAGPGRPQYFEWAAYSLYRVSSLYGTSYWRALSGLFLLVTAFSWIFLASGFRLSKDSGEEVRPLIKYAACLTQCGGLSWESFKHWLRDSAAALQFTLSIVTFQKDRFYEPVGSLSRFSLSMAVFLITSQLALLILAIRRRFKR